MRLTGLSLDFALYYRASGGKNNMMLLGLCPKSQLQQQFLAYPSLAGYEKSVNPRCDDWRLERDPYEICSLIERFGFWYADHGSCAHRLRNGFINALIECVSRDNFRAFNQRGVVAA